MIPYAEARTHSEFSLIPEYVLRSLYAYVERHIITGGFLQAVLAHDLFDAVGRADKGSYAALRELIHFIHMELPSQCHGDRQKVADWTQGERPKQVTHVPASTVLQGEELD